MDKFRKISKVNNGGIDVKKSYQKEFKTKRYYGYDDRHNLEDTINNHVENDIYIEPFRIDRFRKMDKSKWVSKKNFIV